MSERTVTCPRCFLTAPLRSDAQFCPRCGLANFQDAASDTAPMDVTIDGWTLTIHDRIAIGSWCSVYRCRFKQASKTVEGAFKIARDPAVNDAVKHEAAILRLLHGLDAEGRYTAFLPEVAASFGFQDKPSSPPRQANVLRLHEKIRSPDELYTLDEVRGHYPRGLNPRDMAWIWRRLLSVLGFAHAHDVVHGAVLPMHVLIEPREHKLVLIDWCGAVQDVRHNANPPGRIVGGYRHWYESASALNRPPTPALDVALGARCMIELIGGDPVAAEFPPKLEPALGRYFERCLGRATGTDAAPIEAWKLLDDFDRVIQALWGRRKFRVLKMPARPKR